ncbi:MAG: glycosyltransferase family 39 protein [Thermoplasmata archaeon]|nr:glycosyltransferase family 39 protein [Thermoplasmata archaeon]
MSGKDRNTLVLFVLALVFIFIRLYNIENPFSTNGIDEGIHLIQAKMVGQGYNLYSELGGDQAPLAILVFSVLKGNVMASRLLSFSLFLVGVSSSFLIVSRLRGRRAGVLAMLVLAMDFTLLRESRLASLDLFSASLLSISALFFIIYMDCRKWEYVAVASLFLSMSCLSKMIAAPFAFLVTIAFLYKMLKDRNFIHLSVYAISFAIPVVLLMLAFTPQELLDGILFRQAGRGFDIYSKLSILLFIGPGFIYLVSLKRWNLKDRKVVFIILWLLSILVFVMIQGRTFQHHFAYVSFPAAILASVVISDLPDRNLKKRALISSFIAVNALISVSLIATAPHDMSYDVAAEIDSITPPGSLVISGNPLVNVLANRDCPPNLTNLAYHHQPPTEPSDIIYWLKNGDVKAVVIYWHLSDMDEVREYLNRSRDYILYGTIEGRGQILFNGFVPEFSEDRYVIYVKRQLFEPGP